jgi:hypothetical protein
MWAHFRHLHPRAFQWYKELFNPMGFDPCNYFLKSRKSIGTLTPKVGAHLGVWRFIPSHSPTFLGTWDVILGLPFWLAPLQAFALVASPKLRLRHLFFNLCTSSHPYFLHELMHKCLVSKLTFGSQL